jgi:Triose-phosphate Transporter family
VGVALATAGDYYFTPFGFVITTIGTILAAVKTVLTNQLQRSLSSPLHTLDLLLRMSPLACLQSVAWATVLGETTSLIEFVSNLSLEQQLQLSGKLVINGALAFALNYVSFTANEKTSPLTMTVAANLKQCFSILLGFWIFNLQEGWIGALGIVIALVGGAWYAKAAKFGGKGDQVEVDSPVKLNEKEIV